MNKKRAVVKVISSPAIAPAIRGVLESLGEDPNREGLQRTPERVEKAQTIAAQYTAPDSNERRALLLSGMTAFLIVSLSIPHAFSDSGTAFGIAYLIVVLVHLGLFSKATEASKGAVSFVIVSRPPGSSRDPERKSPDLFCLTDATSNVCASAGLVSRRVDETSVLRSSTTAPDSWHCGRKYTLLPRPGR